MTHMTHPKMVTHLTHDPRPTDPFSSLVACMVADCCVQSLSAELETTKLPSAVTHNDQLYKKIVAAGRDKYKTLKLIRQGNTKLRVDLFEAL